MPYTNGFDSDLVVTALQQRLGWQQPTIACSPVLSEENLLSTSGRYFGDDFHALCTIENIKASQPDANIMDDDFNTYLFNKQKGMIMRALNEVFRKPELIEQHLLYTRLGMSDMLLQNQNQFCGWCFELANSQAISTQVTLGTFYFNGDVTFNLYVFQDGVRTALKTIPIIVQAYQRTTVLFDELVLNFKTGYRYYILYDQSELGNVQAIRDQPDSFCNSKCFSTYPVQMNKTTDGSIFSVNGKQYPALPNGVNFEVISFKDHTQKIIRQANLFDEVQGLQMAAFALELTNNSTRTNRDQRQSQQQSQQTFIELNQSFATKEVPVTPGLKSRIIAEFKRLRDTFYPPQEPISMNMSDDCAGDMYEKNWLESNVRVFNNPGLYVSS